MLNKYFKQPLFWDYFIAFLLATVSIFAFIKGNLKLPIVSDIISVTTDVTTISLTLAGFILTLLTVLITFKSSTSNKKKKDNNTEQLFNLFFTTPYYYTTIILLKNCIKSLVFIAVVGFGIKLFLPDQIRQYAFFFNQIGLTIIVLTIWRCLLILSKIISYQREEDERRNKKPQLRAIPTIACFFSLT